MTKPLTIRSDNRGGKRPNSGRPKGIETTTIRVPLCLKEIIKRFIKRKTKKNY